MDVAAGARCRVVTYGLGARADWRAEAVSTDGSNTWFKVSRRGEELGRFSIRLPGRHNVSNALGVIALLSELGFDLGCLRQGLASCPGVKRRQEVRGEEGGVLVIDDFAHHPTAVKETLSALRARYPERRLIAIFEPRTNTSRRAVFQQRYAAAFDHADLVLVREVPDPEKAPEGDRFSSRQLVQDLCDRGVVARYFPDAAAIVDFLRQEAMAGDLCAVLSNGPFEGIHQRILEAMSEKGAC
jgi:UDP-N-acetylmuramate: L-alanyl-gamma-D-glutamyl-meso-diaminopimelate ligase